MANLHRRRSLLDWLYVDMDWRISSGAWKGRRYDLDTFPCQEAIVVDESAHISVMKSAQMAISEHFTIQRPFFHLAMGHNWGILFPNQGAMRKFFTTRLKAAIAVNPRVRRFVSAENEGNITAWERTMYLRYTTTETAIATYDADGNTCDETDMHNQETLYGAKTSRMQGSMDEVGWYDVSTPTYPKFGIHQEHLNSDQHTWHIHCEHCQKENDLTRRIGEFDIAEADKFFRDYLGRYERWEDFHIPCSHCGRPIDPVVKYNPNRPSEGGGRWVAAYPSRDHRGYHLQVFQRLYTGGTPRVLARMRESLLRANRPEHLKRWWNYVLGVPYTPPEGRITTELIEQASTMAHEDRWTRDRMFPNVFLIEGQRVNWMGVDVRAGQYHIFGLAHGGGDKELVTLVGWVAESWEVRNLWERMGEPVFVLDAEPDTNEGRTMVKAMGRMAYRAKFQKGIYKLWQETGEKRYLIVNRPKIMEAVKAAIETRRWSVPTAAWNVGSGVFTTSADNGVEETLADHFKAPMMIRHEDPVSGNTVYDFPKDAMSGVDPHFYMAACLAILAMEVRASPAKIVIYER